MDSVKMEGSTKNHCLQFVDPPENKIVANCAYEDQENTKKNTRGEQNTQKERKQINKQTRGDKEREKKKREKRK